MRVIRRGLELPRKGGQYFTMITPSPSHRFNCGFSGASLSYLQPTVFLPLTEKKKCLIFPRGVVSAVRCVGFPFELMTPAVRYLCSCFCPLTPTLWYTGCYFSFPMGCWLLAVSTCTRNLTPFVILLWLTL